MAASPKRRDNVVKRTLQLRMQPDDFTPNTPARAHKPGRRRAAKRPSQPRALPNLTSPYKLCTSAEVAMILDVPDTWIAAIKKAGAPFPGGRTRPEWIHDWLRQHPDFALKVYRG